jgi:anti-sigma-K factor RskA
MKRALEDTMPEGGDDLIAAEYVLGVLSGAERDAAAERVRNERGFARLVDQWTIRLSPFDDAYEDAAPPASVKKALDTKLFASAAQSAAPGFWQSLNLWRALTFGAMAVAAFAIVPNLGQSDPPSEPRAPLVAAMQAADSGEVRFVALYQPGSDEIRISRVKAQKGADKDYELWLIEGGAKPVSMGVIPDQGEARLKVTPELVKLINSGDVFAVTVEQRGGSPTGDPQGPVVAAGASQSI